MCFLKGKLNKVVFLCFFFKVFATHLTATTLFKTQNPGIEYLPNPSLFFLQAKNITYPLLVSISSFLRITTTFLHDDNIQGVSYWCDSFSKVTGGNALSNKNMETVALWNLSHPYETPCSSTRWQCRALK